MNQGRCVFEEQIERASRSGHWNDELLAHVAQCRECEEMALVMSYLSASSRATAAADAELPDPGRIWWKAQLSAKAARMERALRPIVWARRFALGAFAAAMVAAMVLWWPQIAAFGGALAEMWTRRSATASASRGNFLSLGVAVFLVFLVPFVFGLYAVWSED